MLAVLIISFSLLLAATHFILYGIDCDDDYDAALLFLSRFSLTMYHGWRRGEVYREVYGVWELGDWIDDAMRWLGIGIRMGMNEYTYMNNHNHLSIAPKSFSFR